MQPRMNCLLIDSEINSAASGGYITLLAHLLVFMNGDG